MMKKTVLILFIIFTCHFSLMAVQQVNDNPSLEVNKIKAAARQWFKNTYLKSKFPDAHAYKILKFEATSVSKLEQIKLEIDKATQGINANDTLAAGSNYSHYLHIIVREQLAYGKIVAASGSESQAALEKKKAIDQYAEKIKDTKLKLNKAIKAESFWNQALKELPADQANSTAYFNIYMECQWKTASGKKMSGNYYFNFDKNGLIGEVSENTF